MKHLCIHDVCNWCVWVCVWVQSALLVVFYSHCVTHEIDYIIVIAIIMCCTHHSSYVVCMTVQELCFGHICMPLYNVDANVWQIKVLCLIVTHLWRELLQLKPCTCKLHIQTEFISTAKCKINWNMYKLNQSRKVVCVALHESEHCIVILYKLLGVIFTEVLNVLNWYRTTHDEHTSHD